ncbi:hypothetical protein C8R45DRAFT_943712 [Mycena sanguinolenta]|nr:hypothetical protein C8R45DRAFT_943712 [Mycena sanguinolenta]
MPKDRAKPVICTCQLRRPQSRSPLSPHAFWVTTDIVLYMLRFLNLIEIMQLAHIDKSCAAYIKTYLKGWICRYISPFFTKVSLSVALAAASVLSDAPQPTNLNVITVFQQLGDWRRFLMRWSSGPYASAGGWATVFKHKAITNYYVTITTSRLPTLGPLFFSSPNTDQMVAISAYELITPVLKNVPEQQHLRGCEVGTSKLAATTSSPFAQAEFFGLIHLSRELRC